MRGQHRRILKSLVIIVGFVLLLNIFIATILNQTFGRVACQDNSYAKFSNSGVIDTTNEWKKLGLATYVFTAYVDDREPCSTIITVLGFGEKSESSLHGTLVLTKDVKIHLGMCKDKKKLNPTGDYTLGKLGPFAYSWPLPADVTNTSYLKSITLKQTHPITGTKVITSRTVDKVFRTRVFHL